MNVNELEALKPGPGLALAEVTETGEAVLKIQEAHAVLSKSYGEVMRKIEERRKRQELGVSIPICELNDWHQWQATALRRFHEIRWDAAGRVLVLCDERLAADASGINKREGKIAKGLGEILNDAQAGADLCAMLMRLTGGVPRNDALREICAGWRRILETSRRALIELPKMPEPKPTAKDNALVLEKILTGKDGTR